MWRYPSVVDEFHHRGLLSGVAADCLWGVDCRVSVYWEYFKDWVSKQSDEIDFKASWAMATFVLA